METDISTRLKTLLLDTLNFEDLKPEEIGDDEPLHGSRLALDSIDTLELVVRIEKEFGIKIKNSEDARTGFQSIATLRDFILERKAEQQGGSAA